MMESHQATVRRMKEGGIKVKFGQKIESHRNRLGMTQRELAKALGVSPPAVHYWENSKRCPKGEHMRKLAELFDSSIEVLFFDESDRLR